MKKLDALTGIRALAALWVILLHLSADAHYAAWVDFGWLTPLVRKGYLGVDLFFLLSGFVISYAYRNKLTHPDAYQTLKFWSLRVARLMPLHWAMLLFYIPLYWLGAHYGIRWEEPARFSLAHFIYNVFNIQAWGLSSCLSWNKAAWSVSAEWFAYLLFPLLTLGVGRMRTLFSNGALITLTLIFMAFFFSGNHYNSLDWTYQGGLVRVSTEFLIGCCLYNFFEMPAFSQRNWGSASTLLAILIISALFLHIPDVAVVGLLAGFLLCLSNSTGWLQNALSTGMMVMLGEISYSIYMVSDMAKIVLTQILKHFPSEQVAHFGFLIPFVLVAAILCCARFAYERIEKPARNFLNAWFQTLNLSPLDAQNTHSTLATHMNPVSS